MFFLFCLGDDSMLRHATSPRHFVLNDHLVAEPPSPPKKRPFFLRGGYVFFEINSSIFCPFRIKKFLERLGGLSRSSGHISDNSRPITAANQNSKFQKYEIFAIFEQSLDFFFSNVRMLSKIV